MWKICMFCQSGVFQVQSEAATLILQVANEFGIDVSFDIKLYIYTYIQIFFFFLWGLNRMWSIHFLGLGSHHFCFFFFFFLRMSTIYENYKTAAFSHVIYVPSDLNQLIKHKLNHALVSFSAAKQLWWSNPKKTSRPRRANSWRKRRATELTLSCGAAENGCFWRCEKCWMIPLVYILFILVSAILQYSHTFLFVKNSEFVRFVAQYL